MNDVVQTNQRSMNHRLFVQKTIIVLNQRLFLKILLRNDILSQFTSFMNPIFIIIDIEIASPHMGINLFDIIDDNIIPFF